MIRSHEFLDHRIVSLRRDTRLSETPQIALRIQASDQALLFISSFMAVIAAIAIGVFGSDLAVIVITTPFFVTAVVLPLYVGYMRGAIECNSFEERARGWVYLIIGSGFYALSITFQTLRLPAWQYLIAGPLELLLTLFLAVFGFRFVKWFFKSLAPEVPVTPEGKTMIWATADAAVIMTFFWILMIQILLPYLGSTLFSVSPSYASNPVLNAPSGALFLLGAMLIEVNCHHYVDNAQTLVDRWSKTTNVLNKQPSKFLAAMLHLMSGFYSGLGMLGAGRRHRKQYVLMMLGYLVLFVGLIVELGAGPVFDLSVPLQATGLGVQFLGVLISLAGLLWHIQTSPGTISTSRTADVVFDRLKRRGE